MRRIVFIAFAFAFLSQTATALQCFNCNECENNFIPRDCESESNACLLKEVVGGIKTGRIDRSCTYVYDVDALKDTCITQQDSEGNDVMYCVCNTNLCNGTERMGFGLLAAVVGLLLYSIQ